MHDRNDGNVSHRGACADSTHDYMQAQTKSSAQW